MFYPGACPRLGIVCNIEVFLKNHGSRLVSILRPVFLRNKDASGKKGLLEQAPGELGITFSTD